MRSRRALLNFSFSFARNIVGTVLSLIATPFVLKMLGEERFGAFRLLLDWTSHLSILEFGLFSASLALLSKAATEGQVSQAGTLRLIFRHYFVIFAIQLCVYILFSLFIKYLIPVSPSLVPELQLSALIMSISLIFIMSQIYKAYLESAQKGYFVSIVLVIFNITYLGLSLLFAYYKYGLAGQSLAYVISLFISFVLFVFFAPQVLKLLFKFGNNEHHHQLLKQQRFSHFVNELCSRISLMSDNIIVSLFMGATPVTAFFITQKSGSMMQQQLQHLSNSSWAALSELYYQNKKDVFRERVLNLTELVAYSSGVLLSVVCLLNPAFVCLWTGKNTFAGMDVSNLTAINAGFFSILSLWSWCFAATNNTDKMVHMSIAQGVVNIIASLFLTYWLGLPGPLWGTLIGYAGISLFWKSSVLSITFEISFSELTKKWFLPFIPPLALSILYLYFYGPVAAHSWLSLLGWGTLLTFFFSFFSYFLLISRSTQNLLFEKFKLLINKVRRI